MLYSCDDDFSYSPFLVFTSFYPRCCLAMAFFFLAVVVVRYDTKHRCKFVISVAAAAFSYSSSTDVTADIDVAAVTLARHIRC